MQGLHKATLQGANNDMR